ncbi:hypothetical protein ILYODFUR_033689 [Ilyodon furcidens]|uniref:Uncharacterized protein n=1 Tax=Ilyodon furcidens TaxID=33524 RepID=A0ABV0TP06_9TELE
MFKKDPQVKLQLAASTQRPPRTTKSETCPPSNVFRLQLALYWHLRLAQSSGVPTLSGKAQCNPLESSQTPPSASTPGQSIPPHHRVTQPGCRLPSDSSGRKINF